MAPLLSDVMDIVLPNSIGLLSQLDVGHLAVTSRAMYREAVTTLRVMEARTTHGLDPLLHRAAAIKRGFQVPWVTMWEDLEYFRNLNLEIRAFHMHEPVDDDDDEDEEADDYYDEDREPERIIGDLLKHVNRVQRAPQLVGLNARVRELLARMLQEDYADDYDKQIAGAMEYLVADLPEGLEREAMEVALLDLLFDMWVDEEEMLRRFSKPKC